MEQLHKIIRLADLPDYTGLRRTQIEFLIEQGKFPRPVRLSARRKAWLETEIIAWQQARIAERDTGEKVASKFERFQPRNVPNNASETTSGMSEAGGSRR